MIIKNIKKKYKKWLDDNCHQGMSVSPWITPMKPDLGFYIKVDVLEIPESIFPDEVKNIIQTYHNVLEKLKNHYIETKVTKIQKIF